MDQNRTLEILMEAVNRAVGNTSTFELAELSPGYYLGPNTRLLLTPQGLTEQPGVYSITDEEPYWQELRPVNPTKELVSKYRLTEELLRKFGS